LNAPYGPAGMASEIVGRLNAEIGSILSLPEVKKRMEGRGHRGALARHSVAYNIVLPFGEQITMLLLLMAAARCRVSRPAVLERGEIQAAARTLGLDCLDKPCC
jgi:hypothetical protein